MRFNISIKESRFTLITFITGVCLYSLSHVFDYDLFENFLAFLESVDEYEIDELLIFTFLFSSGIIADLLRIKVRRNRIIDIQNQRLETMQATMVTVQDFVGNALNGLQGMRIKIEYNDTITPEDIKNFDKIIHETSEKMNQLRSMNSVSFKNVAKGIVGLDIKS